MIAFTVKGHKQALRKLEQLQKKQYRKAVREASKVVTRDTKETVPVQTGALKRAVKTRAAKAQKGITAAKTTISFKGGNQFYGGFLEYGTRFIEGRHFMLAAKEQAQAEAIEVFKRLAKGELLR